MFQEALEAYKSCLEWVPDTNLTIRRDVWEGMARCYSNLGQGERALELADLLVCPTLSHSALFRAPLTIWLD